MRVFADEDFSLGSRLDLDIYLPDRTSVRCWAQVVWRLDLGASGPARFDVGLKFMDIAPHDIQRLATVLVPAP
jgi:hypothetical protein